MTALDISIVIPAYNAEKFIIDALESICQQTQLPCEVIVVNDGSTDRTGPVIQKWIDNTQPGFPVCLIQQTNKGLPATRNVGIAHATGQWIALLDADDIWENTHLEKLNFALDLEPAAIAAYGAGRLLHDGKVGEVLYDDFWDKPSRQYGKPISGTPCYLIDHQIFPRLIKGNFIKPSSLMFDRRIAMEIGLFNEALRTAEDREFLARLSRKGIFVYHSEPVTQYRWHDDNISQTKNAKRNAENALRALKVIHDNKDLQLNHDEIAACLREIRATANGYLYACCKEGWKQYGKGLGLVRQLFGFWTALTSVNPKYIVLSFIS